MLQKIFDRPVVSFDIETSSAAPLQTVGSYRYVADVSTRALMFAWHLMGSPDRPQLWCEGDPVPEDFCPFVQSGSLFSGWNVMSFDRVAYRTLLVERWGFPPIPDDNWVDSMHRAVAANLPRSLDGCAKAVGMPFEANLKDSNRIKRVTNALRTPIPATVADILAQRVDVKPALLEDLRWLAARCVQDVEMEEGVLMRLPDWPRMHPWLCMPQIDRAINDRGILLDVRLAEGLATAAKIETARLDIEMNKLTGGQVAATTNVESLKTWLVSRGVELPSSVIAEDDEEETDENENRKSPWRLRKSDIADLIARNDVPEDCRLALTMRAEAAKASVRKLRAMLACASPDGRLHRMLHLMGAQATGRWSAGKAQLHNMVRDKFASFDDVATRFNLDPKRDKDKIKALIPQELHRAIEDGRTGDADLLRSRYEIMRVDMQKRVTLHGVLPWISRMMRRTLSAPAGRLLFNGDFANIEARIPVWLAGQEETVQQFARGEDLYRIAAAPVYGLPPEELSSEQRQIGKVMRLFLGFMGGVNAFIPAAMNYGIIISREDGTFFVKTFRETNALLVTFANANLHAARQAIIYPGQEFSVPPKGLVSWIRQGDCLLVRLPSGRYLHYWAPRLEQGYWQDGKPKEELDVTVLVVKGKMTFRRTLWRGLAIENITQAIAADMLAVALENMQRNGLPVVLHVHDSVAAEVDADKAERLRPVFEACMLDQPNWSKGLPVAVDATIDARFG